MKPFFVLLSIDLILLITWTVISPSTFVRIQIEGSEDRFGRTNSFNQCLWGNDESKTSYFVLKQLLQIFDLVTIAILAYYAYRSRSISTEYNESTWIGLIIYIYLEISFIRTILFLSFKPGQRTFLLVYTVFVFFNSLSILLLIFVPKKIALQNEKKEKLRKKKMKKLRMERSRLFFDAINEEQKIEVQSLH
uniref:G-protein coupled receptors family 3 profile domain-containing protein n=2 Tax=Ditylum brightwellii TaxID=49249 RepID=A0A6V2A2P0_9STRA